MSFDNWNLIVIGFIRISYNLFLNVLLSEKMLEARIAITILVDVCFKEDSIVPIGHLVQLFSLYLMQNVGPACVMIDSIMKQKPRATN